MKQTKPNNISSQISTSGLSSPLGEVPQAEGSSGEMPKRQRGQGSNKATSFSAGYSPLFNLMSTDSIAAKNAKDYIPFGDDNLLPQQIIQLSRTVTIHRAIINSKADYFAGNNIASDNNTISAFLHNVNNTEESLHEVISKVIFDDVNMGNAYIEIVTDAKKSYLSLFHVDSSNCRVSANNNSIIQHPNWEVYKGENDDLRTEIPLYPYFKKGNDKQYHSILHIKQYEPQFAYYGLPSWYAGLNSLIIAGLTDRWNQNRLENQFNAPGMLFVPGVNSVAEETALDKMFGSYSGVDAEKAHNLLVQYLADLNPGQTREKAQYIEFNRADEGNWTDLHNQAYSNMLSIHGWFKTLCSFFGEKTGFDTQRILNEYEVALNTSIKSWQTRYSLLLNKLFTDFNLPTSELKFINQSPVYRLNPVKYIWELRRDAGLDYDKTDPKQKLFYNELKNTFNASNEKSTDKIKHENKL